MNMLPCCSTQDNGSFKESKALNPMISTRQGSVFSSFVKNMSRKIGSSRQRHITDHIRKVGIAKVSLQAFTYQELVAATDDFNPDGRLGEGGFGNVYRGYMESINQVVAVKQLNRNGQQGSREFLTEVLMLSLVQHENLVQLLGYCADDDHRILVYEYMQNDSLEKHLFDLHHGKEPLDWTMRMKIALGAAQGLAYLHDEANPQIIYRDFKASNILLDGDFNPRLSDFGLAKLGPKNRLRHVSTRVMGTFGYCAPEYQQTGQLTAKSDVYSFGVVFLEILSGRRAIDIERPTEEQNLIYWAEPLFKDKNMFTVMADPLLEGNYPVKSLYQALAVAAMCLQEEADTRPLMADVVSALRFLAMPECMENSPTVASMKSASLYAADADVEDVKAD